MSDPAALIIEAGQALLGVSDKGEAQTRRDCALLIEDGRISEIGDLDVLIKAHPDLPREGGDRFVAMPGLVNAHHHFGVTPLMQGVPFGPLEFWLAWFRSMRPIPPRLDTLYAAIEMLESGTTSVQHILGGLSGSSSDWQSGADDILSAYGEAGMRAGFCFMVRDQNILAYRPDAEVLEGLPPDVRDWIAPQLAAADIPVAEQMQFARTLQREWSDRAPDHVRINVAPANLHWCSDAALEVLFDAARAMDTQVHMHLVETRRQALYAKQRTGRSAIAHLHALGCLGDNVTLGHGNWLDPDDLDLLSECGCTICHNASSGLRLGSGIAPINVVRAHDIPVALGIDQSNIADDRDMLLEMKLVWALHRETGLFNARPAAADVLRMATEHGAKTLGFEGLIGRLAPGYAADIVLLDRATMERPRVSARTPLADAIVNRAQSHAVSQVFIAGRKVVSKGRVTTIDRDAVLAEIDAHLAAPMTDAERYGVEMNTRLVSHLEGEQRAMWGNAHSSYDFNAFANSSRRH